MSGSAVCVTCNQRFWGHGSSRAEAEVPTAGTHLRVFPSFPLCFHISAHWLLLLVLPTHGWPPIHIQIPTDASGQVLTLPTTAQTPSRHPRDAPGHNSFNIPNPFGLWPRQGPFSPQSALYKEESSSAPILRAEGRHPSQPVQACLQQPGSVLSPDSCLLLLPQDGPPSPGESTQ